MGCVQPGKADDPVADDDLVAVDYSCFNYSTLNDKVDSRKKLVSDDDQLATGYRAFIIPGDGFIHINSTKASSDVKTQDYETFKGSDLKFHISVDNDNVPNNRERGWDIVKDILMKDEVMSFKVVKRANKMSNIPNQQGKDITIYADANPEKTVEDWKDLLTVITEALVAGNVQPGMPTLKEGEQPMHDPKGNDPRPDRPIGGPGYCSYGYRDGAPTKDGKEIDLLNGMHIDVEPLQQEQAQSQELDVQPANNGLSTM